MLVEIRELAPGETLRLAFEESVALVSDGSTVETPAHGQVQLHRRVRSVRLQGHVEADMPLICSRCLGNVTGRLAVDLDEEFSLGEAPPPHGGELGPEDFVSWIGTDQPLDIGEIVRQHLQLAVPMAPLCRPECRGLCPVCGANWNDLLCDHYWTERGG